MGSEASEGKEMGAEAVGSKMGLPGEEPRTGMEEDLLGELPRKALAGEVPIVAAPDDPGEEPSTLDMSMCSPRAERRLEGTVMETAGVEEEGDEEDEKGGEFAAAVEAVVAGAD